MAVVDIKKIEEDYLKNKKKTHRIERIEVGPKTYFKGPHIDATYDSYNECITANQDKARLDTFKSLGLNEYGQSAEDVRRSKAIAKIVAEKSLLEKRLASLDMEIAYIKAGKVVKEEEKVEDSKRSKK